MLNGFAVIALERTVHPTMCTHPLAHIRYTRSRIHARTHARTHACTHTRTHTLEANRASFAFSSNATLTNMCQMVHSLTFVQMCSECYTQKIKSNIHKISHATQCTHTQKNAHARARNDTHCYTLQHSVRHCNILHDTATAWFNSLGAKRAQSSTLQDTLTHTSTHWNPLQPAATHCSTLQPTATHCSTLLHTTTLCNTLQHTATYCNTLQQHDSTRRARTDNRLNTTGGYWFLGAVHVHVCLCTCVRACVRACVHACVHAYVCISLTKVVSHWTFWSRAKLWWSIRTGAKNEKLASVPPSSGRNDTYVYLIFAQQCIHECSGIRIWICVYTNTKCAREYECVPPIYVWLCTTHTHICIYECGGFIHLSTYVVHLCTWESITNANMQMHHTFL